ncbi:MAG: hypothetical protein ACM3XM_02485 [Mycobacterium leprae]
MLVVWLLALYGLVCLVWEISRFLRLRAAPVLSLLLLVHNQEQQVEGFLRSLLGLLRNSSGLSRDCRLLVVDLASTDQTGSILARLAQADPAIRFLRLAPEEMAEAYQLAHQDAPDVALSVALTGRTEAREVLKLLAAICR